MRRTLGIPQADEQNRLLLAALVLGVFYTLYFAASLIFPVYLAFLLSFALAPLVRGMRRLWIPAPLGAGIVLAGVVAVTAYGVVSLSGPATEWMKRGPAAAKQIEQRLRVFKQPLEQVTKATESVDDLTKVNSAEAPTVEIREPGLADSLFSSTREFLAEGLLVVVLLYFLLASADGFMPKVTAAFALPRASRSKHGAEILQRVETEISAYLMMVTVINAGLGVATAILMYFLGMPSPLLWGASAFLLNFIPLIGPFCCTVILGVVALLTFPEITRAAIVPLAFVCLTTVEGWFITPSLVGRRLTLSPIAIVLSLFLWSWLWGAPGALIAVPTLAIFKIVCERIESMHGVAAVIDA
jgi:predicted PurR-regulated permease PerM